MAKQEHGVAKQPAVPVAAAAQLELLAPTWLLARASLWLRLCGKERRNAFLLHAAVLRRGLLALLAHCLKLLENQAGSQQSATLQ